MICMYFLSKFTYIQRLGEDVVRKKNLSEDKKNIEDGYELYIFHEMSKCDIGYIKTNKNTSETRKRETFLISRKLNKLENIFRYLL